MDSTEQSPVDSVSDAVDAMDAKLFGPEEPEQEEADDGAPEAAADDDSADEAEEDQAESEEVEAEATPGEPNDPKQLRALMTRKTQEAATQTELAHDRLQFAEAREQFASAVMQEVAELKAMQAQLKQYEGFDWSALYNSDPGTALKLRDQRDDLQRKIQQVEGAIGGKARNLEAMQAAHYEKQWNLAVKGVKERIGNITQAEDNAMLQQAMALGFNLKELKGRYADPRILQAIHKAAKYDAIAAGKDKALATVRQAPPVVKKGATDPAMSEKMKNLNLSKQMKNARSNKEKSSLAADYLASKFFG